MVTPVIIQHFDSYQSDLLGVNYDRTVSFRWDIGIIPSAEAEAAGPANRDPRRPAAPHARHGRTAEGRRPAKTFTSAQIPLP